MSAAGVSFIMAPMKQTLARRFSEVKDRISIAAENAGRDPSDVKLVSVSKTHPAEILREGIDAGISVFGENKVQEGISKILEIGREKAEWHLIGHLQKNKARKAVQNFDVIQTVDSVSIAKRLERICEEEGRTELTVLAQVDLAGESTKSGIAEAELGGLIDCFRSCNHLKFTGLMIIPPFFSDPEKVRPYFKRLRKLRDKLLKQQAFSGNFGELSMGMSQDFETAVEEGATIVRVGTAIFGERQK